MVADILKSGLACTRFAVLPAEAGPWPPATSILITELGYGGHWPLTRNPDYVAQDMRAGLLHFLERAVARGVPAPVEFTEDVDCIRAVLRIQVDSAKTIELRAMEATREAAASDLRQQLNAVIAKCIATRDAL